LGLQVIRDKDIRLLASSRFVNTFRGQLLFHVWFHELGKEDRCLRSGGLPYSADMRRGRLAAERLRRNSCNDWTRPMKLLHPTSFVMTVLLSSGIFAQSVKVNWLVKAQFADYKSYGW
jgi:hypothetical protein